MDAIRVIMLSFNTQNQDKIKINSWLFCSEQLPSMCFFFFFPQVYAEYTNLNSNYGTMTIFNLRN